MLGILEAPQPNNITMRSLTFDEAARLLGVTRQTLDNWVAKGKIAAFKPGGSRIWLFDPNEVERARLERVSEYQAEIDDISQSVWDYLKED